MPRDKKIKSVLIIGSGPIIIGQACEFDYAGSQASRSLREEGIEVSLINSNPATIMTDKVTADHIYLLPLNVSSIIKILEERKIDAVLPTMGGQTALNLCIKADEMGIWKKYGVRIIGVDIQTIEITENREKFRKCMEEIGVACAPSAIANSFLKAKKLHKISDSRLLSVLLIHLEVQEHPSHKLLKDLKMHLSGDWMLRLFTKY